MEFPSSMLHFHVVIVVRQGDPDGCQLVPQLVEAGRLGLELLVALSLAIRKRTGIGHDDPRSRLLGAPGQGDDPLHFLVDFRAVVQHAAGIDRPQFQIVPLELSGQGAYLIGRTEGGLQAVEPAGRQLGKLLVERDFCLLLVAPANGANRPLVDRYVETVPRLRCVPDRCPAAKHCRGREPGVSQEFPAVLYSFLHEIALQRES